VYLDYTGGILRCQDPGGTRELNPNVKRATPEWQYAYSKVVDNNEWGYSTSDTKKKHPVEVYPKSMARNYPRSEDKPIQHHEVEPQPDRYPNNIRPYLRPETSEHRIANARAMQEGLKKCTGHCGVMRRKNI
jgi:hypothetical protein